MTKSIFDKRYISKAAAQAAANKAGLTAPQIDRAEGEKMWRVTEPSKVTQAAVALAAPEPTSTLEVPANVREKFEEFIKTFRASIEAAQTEKDLATLYDILNARTELDKELIVKLDEDIGIRAGEIEVMANLEPKKPETPATKPWIRESSVEKPTKLVWVIADKMVADAEKAGQPAPTRAQVQAACVEAGIASGTARTQYQHWFKMRNESANEPRSSIDGNGKIVPAKKGKE